MDSSARMLLWSGREIGPGRWTAGSQESAGISEGRIGFTVGSVDAIASLRLKIGLMKIGELEG